MRKSILALKPFISEISRDFMLAMCIIAPVLTGMVYRFLLPALESLLTEYRGLPHILAPYYIVFDLLLAAITPVMFCYASVLVMLEDLDTGMAKYIVVTPIGKSGYFMSRIGIPTCAAMIYDVGLLVLFSLSGNPFVVHAVFAIGGGLMAILNSLLVISFAKNKMEGMALIKLCGLLLLGIPAAYFVAGPVQYVFAILPSFWLAKFSMTLHYGLVIPVLLSSCVTIAPLYRTFMRRFL